MLISYPQFIQLRVNFSISMAFPIFASASLIRPAPIEPPQGRNAARVDGCSGAM